MWNNSGLSKKNKNHKEHHTGEKVSFSNQREQKNFISIKCTIHHEDTVETNLYSMKQHSLKIYKHIIGDTGEVLKLPALGHWQVKICGK